MAGQEFEKQKVQVRLTDLPFLPWSSSSDLPVRGALSIPGGKEHPYLWRQGDSKKNLNKQVLLVSPVQDLAHSYPLSCQYFPMTFYSSSNLVEKHSSLTFLGVFISLWSLQCHVKLIWSKFSCFSLVNPCLVCPIYRAKLKNLEE